MLQIRALLAVLSLGLASLAGPVRASEDVEALADLLDMVSVLSVMREEGLAAGESLATDMLGGEGGAEWQAELAVIYDPDRQMKLVMTAFEEHLEGADTAAMVSFFSSDLGRRATVLEISARKALLDPSVDDAATLALEDALATNDPRLGLLRAYIASGDLIENNVMGGLNANYAFYRGFAEGGGSDFAMTEEEMLSEVWSREEEIRADMEDWLLSYLLLAYAPLSDDELQAYIDFANSAAGKQMNRALFATFDALFSDTSLLLGRAAARQLRGEAL